VATKRGKKAVVRTPVTGKKAAAKPAAKAQPAAKALPAPRAKALPPSRAKALPAPKAPPAAKPAGTRPVATRPAEPSLLERAEALRDAIQRSKLTAPDPWAYTAKARGWGVRAQELVDRIARDGATPGARQGLEQLSGEVEGDREFQEARRLF
jgi:hypothetical protein